ncbi:MAG: glycosyltransferase family 4 protein [Planctomycetales bacterium]|nr:glycosyltransferase family 4 protein [Planctomycetales bacterium]
MKVAILHHHLNRGGVSQVTQNHLRALATLPERERPERVLLIYDGQRDGWPGDLCDASGPIPIEHVVVPQIAYDSADTPFDPASLAEAIHGELAKTGFRPADTVLHIHNPTLGKNASLPGAIERLARSGWKQLLQVHDFAEDNRPENYARVEDPATLYPQAAQVHYATLTSRDAAVLHAAGLDENRLHLLPNPVAEFGHLPDKPSARARVTPALGLPLDTRLIVYPVRGIRRKNLGEMLLLAVLAPPGSALAVTLAPKNPVERNSFDRWQALAEELALPCRFDTAEQHGATFHDMLAASDAVLTTSVAEGFGMVFLEAWLADRPLLGRNLPDLTSDFAEQGVRFDGMYPKLSIPSELLDVAALKQDMAQRYADACRAYGLVLPPEAHMQASIESQFDQSGFDFGRLTPEQQAAVIRHAARDLGAKQAIVKANVDLFSSLEQDVAKRIEANATAVRTAYSVGRIGGLLRQAYRVVLDGVPGSAHNQRFDSQAVLRHFVTPTNLYPVRTQ